MMGLVWGSDNLTSLFKSAQNLNHIKSDLPLLWSTLLPLVSPDIECFWDQGNAWTLIKKAPRRVTLHELQTRFEAYPPTSNSFHRLYHLGFDCEMFDPDALHYLCSHLTTGPLLTSFGWCRQNLSLLNYTSC